MRHAAHVSGGEPPEEGSMPSSVVMSWDAGQISGLLLVSANRRTAVTGGHIFSKRRSAWGKMGPAFLRPWHRLQIYAVLSGYALAQVRQKWWGWEIIAAMTVNTSKIKNSDSSNEGNNHHAMLENMTHTPWRQGSGVKERNKGLNYTQPTHLILGILSKNVSLIVSR